MTSCLRAHSDPDTLCHALWGSVTSSGSGAVRGTPSTRTWQACRSGQQKYPEDLRIDAAMHTTVACYCRYYSTVL